MIWAPTRFRRPAFLIALAGTWPLPLAARADADAGTPSDVKVDPNVDAGTAFNPDGSADVVPAIAAPPAPALEDETPAYLRGSLNHLDMGDLFVILKGKDVLIKVADIEKSGVETRDGVRMKRADDMMISLRSLAPLVTFVFDERSLSLTITADPRLFKASVLDLRAKRPEGIVYGTQPSLFLNYQVRAGDLQEGSGTRVYGFGESGLSIKGHLLYGSVQRNDYDGSWQRLLTNLTFD